MLQLSNCHNNITKVGASPLKADGMHFHLSGAVRPHATEVHHSSPASKLKILGKERTAEMRRSRKSVRMYSMFLMPSERLIRFSHPIGRFAEQIEQLRNQIEQFPNRNDHFLDCIRHFFKKVKIDKETWLGTLEKLSATLLENTQFTCIKDLNAVFENVFIFPTKIMSRDLLRSAKEQQIFEYVAGKVSFSMQHIDLVDSVNDVYMKQWRENILFLPGFFLHRLACNLMQTRFSVSIEGYSWRSDRNHGVISCMWRCTKHFTFAGCRGGNSP